MTHDPVEDLLGVYALERPRRRRAGPGRRPPRRVPPLPGRGRRVPGGGGPAWPCPARRPRLRVWDRIADAIDGTDADVAPPPLRLVLGDPRRRRGAACRRPRRRAGCQCAGIAAVGGGHRRHREPRRVDGPARPTASTTSSRARSWPSPPPQAFSQPRRPVTAELAAPTASSWAGPRCCPTATATCWPTPCPTCADGTTSCGATPATAVVSLGPLGAAPTVRSFPAAGTLTRLMITAEDRAGAGPHHRPPSRLVGARARHHHDNWQLSAATGSPGRRKPLPRAASCDARRRRGRGRLGRGPASVASGLR